VDKATGTDDHWSLLLPEADELSADDAEQHLVLETLDASASSQLRHAPDTEREQPRKGELRVDERSRSVQKLHRVHWATPVREEDERTTSRRSENFADELLLLAPWSGRASVSRLSVPAATRHRAVLARSDEHMFIMELDSPDEEETRDDRQSLGDRVNTAGDVRQQSAKPSVAGPRPLVHSPDGNCALCYGHNVLI